MQVQRRKRFSSLLPDNITHLILTRKLTVFSNIKTGLKQFIYSSSPSYLQCYMKANKRSLLDVSLELTWLHDAAGGGLLPIIIALWRNCFYQSDFEMGIYIHRTPLGINAEEHGPSLHQYSWDTGDVFRHYSWIYYLQLELLGQIFSWHKLSTALFKLKESC